MGFFHNGKSVSCSSPHLSTEASMSKGLLYLQVGAWIATILGFLTTLAAFYLRLPSIF